MANVSISEAARLASVSRPTIYKMIHSGKLTFTSVVKSGKSVKVIDISELIRVFGALNGITDDYSSSVKSDSVATVVNSGELQDLQHQIALLQLENSGLKEAVSARDEHIHSLRHAMQLLEHKSDNAGLPSPWWKFWKR